MRIATLLSLLSVFSFASASHAQLVFNFNATSNTPQQVIDGFIEAGQLWSNVINDLVTVDINIDYAALSGGQIGATSATVGVEAYSDFTMALGADVTSAADASSFANLQSGNSFGVWSNLSAENPNGAGSPTPYYDTGGSGIVWTNNTDILYTSANARAIGIDTPLGNDGSITFNSNTSWDFDRSDGISNFAFDFVGVAAHEIGHILGFTSGVDNIDASPGGSENDNPSFLSNPLDLFRFSNQSLAQGAGVPDMTASTLEKYFSVDGGVTSLGNFSLGVNFGGDFQASHWKDGAGLGMMDPSLNLGEFLTISQLDLTGFDVIGWNLAPVPEPGSMVFLLLGISGLALRRSRR